MNLLSGQTVFLTAEVIEPLRYIAVDREDLRKLLFDDSSLSELLLPAFVERREFLQKREGIGFEILGPADSHETRDLVEFARRMRLPFTWVTPDKGEQAAALIAGLDEAEIPLVRLAGGGELRRPSHGELSRALGIGLELKPSEEVDLLILGGGPGGLGAAVYGASEGLETLLVEGTVLGGQAGTSRRIENYLGFPAGISGSELTSRAIAQARKFGARTATPYRAQSLSPDGDRHIVKLEEGNEIAARAVVLSTGAEYRRLPVEGLAEYEGISVFYAAGPPEAQLCGGQRVGVIGGGNSAAQAAIWLARGGALVTLLHRRADLSETMSNYLIWDLDRYGVAVRDRSEVEELHGEDGQLEAVTLTDGLRTAARLPLPLPRRLALHRVARRLHRARREGLRPDRRRRGSRGPARDEHPRRLLPPATSARGRSSGVRRRSERARRWCGSCTSGWRLGAGLKPEFDFYGFSQGLP